MIGQPQRTPASSTIRTQRHRERLKKDCTRLDVTIGTDMATKAKNMAKRRNVPLWVVVQDAIEELDKASSDA